MTPRDLAAAVGYDASGYARDHAIDDEGVVRPEWENLFESIHRHGPAVLDEWQAATNRLSRERGLAYRSGNLDDAGGEGWSLDPIPSVISTERWEVLEKGLGQRTRLYDCLLRDIYGDQRVLAEKLLPIEVLMGHPGFLRALHDLTPDEKTAGLGISAFDVAGGVGGKTFVVNDRFDSPFGLGLTLENRTVVNKVLPRLFRRCGVRRIGQFFIDWFAYLTRLAPNGNEKPLVVIVDASQGGDDSEIGFLANYCGILRVHPSDLTARDGQVWIKALRGLVPVDVIWKTMPGKYIDSLEAESSRQRGVAGLFEVMRAGGVALASHPGSEVLQSPGFYPFLPKLCRLFLDEDLLIPPVATWWCGSSTALSHVLSNLSTMVIKSVGSHDDFQTQYGSRKTESELAELKAMIQANPARYAGQEELEIATVPTVRPEGLVPRGTVSRMFSYLDDELGPRVMPGGLGRVSTAEGVVISTGEEGESKDIWVRASEEQRPFSIATVVKNSLPTAPHIMPSRTGDNLYWTGRYAERAQLVARFAARIIEGRMQGFSHDPEFEQQHEQLLVEALFAIFDYQTPKELAKEYPDVLDMILADSKCTISISYNLTRFHFATQATREAWSPASVQAIEASVNQWDAGVGMSGTHFRFGEELSKLQLNLSAFLGLNLDSMTRDAGWGLLDAGRRVERGGIICGLLTFLLKSNVEGDMKTLFNESILYILDSVRTYQSRYHTEPDTVLTTQLLLSEREYPRSFAHVLVRLGEVLDQLPKPAGSEHPAELVEQKVSELEAFVEEMGQAVEDGTFLPNTGIHFLESVSELLTQISDTITKSYFSHANSDSWRR